jgi:dienelactone hydrolase
VHFARRLATRSDRLALVGWSLGGVAAAGLTVHAQQHGVQLGHTVCLAGAFTARDPICGGHVALELSRPAGRSPFTLLHGVADDVVPIGASRRFASTLERNGWPVEFVELGADHGAIAGAAYDAGAHGYSATDDATTLSVATEVAPHRRGERHRPGVLARPRPCRGRLSVQLRLATTGGWGVRKATPALVAKRAGRR